MARNILLPVDGSKHSNRAFSFCLDHIFKEGDHLHFVHITTTPHLPTFSLENPMSLPVDEWTEKLQHAIKESQKIIEHYERSCEERKIAKTTHIESGKAGEAICKVAKDKGVDLIVMGSRGLNSVRRTFMGSVSDYVLHHCTVPLTIVPPEK